MLCPAPLITRENANIMREKGYESKLAKRNAEIADLKRRLESALTPPPEDDQRRKERLLGQVMKCDALMEECDSPKEFAQLVNAKARLWELLYPKPGSLRPKQGRIERAPVVPLSPQPVAKLPALVVPTSDENHNAENVQS
jgi:hypothetical protein